VSPYVAAPKTTRTGLLLRSGNAPATVHRIGVAISGPYGGSVPVGSYLAGALSAGYLRFEDLVRLANSELDRTAVVGGETSTPNVKPVTGSTRSARTALAEDAHDINAGFLGHKTLIAMKGGEVAGAWMLAMEVSPLKVYPPIREALIKDPDVVVILHFGPGWKRMAAWRMASARLDTDAQAGDFPANADPRVLAAARRADHPIWSSDQLTGVADGRPLADTPEEIEIVRAVLERQQKVAEQWHRSIEEWEGILQEVEKGRRKAKRLTVSLTLGELPGDSRGYHWADGRFTLAPAGSEAPGVLYRDELSDMVDAWVEASARVLREFADLGGEPLHRFTERLADGPAKQAFVNLFGKPDE
jgi:hypothetical protein